MNVTPILLGGLVAGVAIIGATVYASQPSDPPIQQWEHGWKTDQITATRYANEDFGFNIGFRYHSAAYDNNADTDAVFDLFKQHGCSILSGGGEPFSEYHAFCEGVTDRASADAKIKTLLPALDSFMQTYDE